MSAENGQKIEVTLPQVVTLNTDLGPYSQGQNEKTQKETRQVSGVMFLDTITQKKIVQDETPKYERAIKKMGELDAKLQAKAKKVALDQKDCDKSKAIKTALNAVNIVVNVVTEFVRLDLDVESCDKIWFKWVITEAGGTGYHNTLISNELSVDVTDDMAKLLEEYSAARKEAKRSKDAIIVAQTKLHDRANRMADAHGALALKNMSTEERDEIKAVYAQLMEGVTVERLLEVGNK